MSELDLYFRFKCEKGLQKRQLDHLPEYRDRLDFEIKVITQMGFPGYFLIVSDFINWALDQGILVGPGRGSAAGSLAAYCLYITHIDPIKGGLLFERFINPDRISMPDIDVDFSKADREKIIEYVRERYGENKVAHIGTFGTMKAKSAVRHTARTLGYEYALGDKIAKKLLPPIAGKTQDLDTSLQKVPELSNLIDQDKAAQDVFTNAKEIENLISNYGVHASGVIISNEPLDDKVPLFVSSHGEPTAQWEMNTIEDYGLIKFDFLGLDALTKIQTCLELIEERHGKKIDIYHIPQDTSLPDVQATYKLLQSGDTLGLFQLEASSGIRDILVRLKPENLEDLCALVALYRPGPLGSGYCDTYLDVKAGIQEPSYLVPALEPILKNTYSIILYQEQAMQIGRELCGYTRGEADGLRKAIGKKLPKLLAEHEPKFKKGWIDNGHDPAAVEQLWEDLLNFAAYCFNKSHALCYAYITYVTAYLKANYTIEFICAFLIQESGNQDQIIKCMSLCRQLGIVVSPPDINKSNKTFSINEDNSINFGLGPIKNLGNKPVEAIIEERKYGSFKSLRDFCERVDLSIINKLKLESLIKAGAFDTLGPNRASMLAHIEDIWAYNKELKSYVNKMATYDKKILACEQRLKDIEEGKTTPKGKPLKPLKEPQRPECPQFPEMKEIDEDIPIKLQKAEHELLGLYISSHPLDNLSIPPECTRIEQMKDMENNTSIVMAGIINHIQEITTKTKKQKMAFVRIEDLTGTIDAVMFAKTYAQAYDLLDETRPLLIQGILDITESDEGQRITKLIVKRISVIPFNLDQYHTNIPINIPVNKIEDIHALLKKYQGNVHTVHPYIKLHDGTLFSTRKGFGIRNAKNAFIKEAKQVINE